MLLGGEEFRDDWTQLGAQVLTEEPSLKQSICTSIVQIVSEAIGLFVLETLSLNHQAHIKMDEDLAQDLTKLEANLQLPLDSLDFARRMDRDDPLRGFRSQFCFPKKNELPLDKEWDATSGDEECVYFCGNSLGLKPKMADKYMAEQLQNWAKMGVFMHFEGKLGAALCDQPGKGMTAELVGAKYPHEVSLMNGLTVNLQLLMLAFYQPTSERFKILIEDHAFPSDRYAMSSLMTYKGYSPEDALIQVKPRSGEATIRTEDLLDTIQQEGSAIAVVILSGVQYYTGQKFDMARITSAARSQGCVVGWDLAHAIGNVELHLHDWEVDFACWCTYKYLNSGAGGIGGAFLHDRHAHNPPPHLLGWWSNKQETRFQMAEKCDMAVGADSFRLCNPPPWLACLNYASLEIFAEAGMERILAKQRLLTGYLEYLIRRHFSQGSVTVDIITPRDPQQRGSQLSLVFSTEVQAAHQELERNGVVCDFRHPSVIRVAPAPLYNSFEDVQRFTTILVQALKG
eukprot:maker-scaffold712_size108441-snap-gene-0.38 protein:Tk06090 transcript:maker-scaffold712_size108441-snap-gene-0.38-mRNA-1 annotation:"hypothetical protein DAPPUDRAFT_310889"